MSLPGDTNASIWKSDSVIKEWAATAAQREAERAPHLAAMGDLLPFEPDADFTFLDLGAGTGAAARSILGRFPNAHAVLTDYSPQMIEEGTRALEPYAGRAHYLEQDLLSGMWPGALPASVDAVVTSLCVHHLPDERKRSLFAEIFERLKAGGWYLNYDPVTSADPDVEAAWLAAHDRLDPDARGKREHRSHDEQLRYENHVRYMIPLEPQLDFLRSAGFRGIDVYWKHLEFVVYGGFRPA